MALVVRDNTPSPGFISWTGLHIVYKGVDYTIQDGNTNKRFVYWKPSVSTTILQTSDTLPELGDDDLLVFLNKNGIHVTVPTSTVVDGSLIVEESILTNALAANAVTAGKIASGAIEARHLAAESVTADAIAAGAIGAGAIAAGAILSEAIASGQVLADHIAAGQIQSNHIAANQIQANHITSGAITAAKIASNAITAAKIASNAITADKIASNAITAAKIASNAITAGKIAAGAINAANLFVDGVITGAKIASETITGNKIAAGAITADKIASNAVTAAKIASNAITADKIASNAVTAAKIAAGAVTVDKIAAGAITADKIAVSQLSAIASNIGTITAGMLRNSANTAGILLSGTVPSGWNQYLNLSDSSKPFLQHPNLVLNQDGSATFSGVVASSEFTATIARFRQASFRGLGSDKVFTVAPWGIQWETTDFRYQAGISAFENPVIGGVIGEVYGMRLRLIGIGNRFSFLSADGNLRIEVYNGGIDLHGTVEVLGSLFKSSSQRWKKNVRAWAPDPRILLSLRPVEFDFVEERGGNHDYGFIAEEVPEVFATENRESVSFDRITTALVVGWQDHESRIAALERALKKLERV